MVRAGTVITLALLFAVTSWASINFVRSDEVNADTYLLESSADSVTAALTSVLWSSADGTDRVPIMSFTVPSLTASETLDSAHIVVEALASAMDSDTCLVYPSLRSVTYAEATWNEYASGSSWQTAGARGALDIDLDSLLYSFVNPTVNPDSIFVARGTAFTSYISDHLGETITLIWQDDGDDSNGAWTAASLEHATELAPMLRLFGTRTVAGTRRKSMLEETR